MLIINKKGVEEVLKKGRIKLFSQIIRRDDIEEIPYEKMKDKFLYLWDGKELFQLTLFDENFYKLDENKGEITLVIDGFRMHNYMTKPSQYAKLLTSRLSPKGKVLECFMGLGYITSELLKRKEVDKVVAIEKSPAVLEFAKINPFTKHIFDSQKITIINGDVEEFLKKDRNIYDYVIADPPSYRYKRARHFYSRTFLKLLLDRLKLGGKLYFYTGRIAKESIGKFLEEASLNYRFEEKLLGYFIVKNKKAIEFKSNKKK